MKVSGRVRRPSRPFQFLGPESVFRKDATLLPRASAEQVATLRYAQKFANQAEYAKGLPGTFDGYAGQGYAGFANGFNTVLNCVSSVAPVYVVRANTPRAKVWLVEESGAEETLRAEGAAEGLQAAWESVPVPDVRYVPLGQLQAEGPDKRVVIVCYETGEMWEFRRWGIFIEGALKGQYKAGYGGYIPDMSLSNGVFPKFWGNSASSFVGSAGAVSMTDVEKVQRGGSIDHALAISAIVVAGQLAPATRHDTRENNVALTPTGEPNPAFGLADAIPEGILFAWPKDSRASDYGMTGRLEVEVYEAGRRYGYYVRDNAPNVTFYCNDPRTLGTKYSDTPFNVMAGIVSPQKGNTAAQVNAYVNSRVPARYTDPTLPPIEEEFHGTTSCLAKYPWRTIEWVVP